MIKKIAIVMIMLILSFILLSPLMAMAGTRQSQSRTAEQEKRAVPKATVEESAEETKKPVRQPEKDAPASKGHQSLKKGNKLDALKIKNVYVKDNNLHVVLQYLGREKLSLQDIGGAALVVDHGAIKNTHYLKSDITLLRQFAVPGKEADVNTGIHPVSELVKVHIKGQKDFFTKKVVVHSVSPLKVPPKQATLGDMSPLKVPPKKIAGGSTSTLSVPQKEMSFTHAKFWDISLDYIEVESWSPPWKLKYDERRKNNEAIYVSADPICDECPMWVKVDAYIKIKSLPRDSVTQSDVGKWGKQSDHIVTKLTLFNIPRKGNVEATVTSVTPFFSWEDVQQWPAEGATFEKKGHLNVELTFYKEGFETKLEDPLMNYAGTLRTYVHVDMDDTNVLDETDEQNNNTSRPVLVLSTSSWPVKILRPGPAVHDNWLIGSMQEIQWKEQNMGGRIRIDLYQSSSGGPDQYIGVIADDIIPPPPGPGPTTQSYNWRAGYLQGGKVADPGIFYWLKFYTVTNGHLYPQPMKRRESFTLSKMKTNALKPNVPQPQVQQAPRPQMQLAP